MALHQHKLHASPVGENSLSLPVFALPDCIYQSGAFLLVTDHFQEAVAFDRTLQVILHLCILGLRLLLGEVGLFLTELVEMDLADGGIDVLWQLAVVCRVLQLRRELIVFVDVHIQIYNI